MLSSPFNPRPRRTLLAIAACLSLSACAIQGDTPASGSDTALISVVGTNDVHGALLMEPGRGGLTTLSGYVSALRAARTADGGVLLVDAGDMWQGTLESNLNEGAMVVAAYNALGYAAATLGNHEFDFGPEGELAIPGSDSDDPRGALKRRAAEANFPLLAANVVDKASNAPVAWNNVQPSVLVDVAGVAIGLIGIVTEDALITTITGNTGGLRISPLAEAIVRENRRLRGAGAKLVIVLAHAGSRCGDFGDPLDLSSCDMSGEIMRVANELPAGLVDQIVAGHVHEGVAHIVNDIAITSAYSSTRAFSRVDFEVDLASGEVLRRQVFAPQSLCPLFNVSSGDCAWADSGSATTRPAAYEGREIVADKRVQDIVDRAADRAAELKMEKLGVVLETPFTLEGNPESPLANLFTDALYESLDVDVVLHNVSGGIRATLPAGELIYGSVFAMFPFDNRVAILDLSGAELRRVVASQAHVGGRRAAFAGMRVSIRCDNDRMAVTMRLDGGREIRDDDRVRIGANDFLTTGGDGILTPAMPAGGFRYADDPRLVREVIIDWFQRSGGRFRAEQFLDGTRSRWNLPESVPASCLL